MAYSEKQKTTIINDVCERISNGEALRTILREEKYPSCTTFYVWIDNDEDYLERYVRATRDRADLIFEQILTIADSQEGDVIIVDGKEVINHDYTNRARLRIDSRKWMLGKMNSKKYGDKLDLTTDGDKINQPAITIVNNGESIDMSS